MSVKPPVQKHLKIQELISDLEGSIKWLKAEVFFWRCCAFLSILLSLILISNDGLL